MIITSKGEIAPVERSLPFLGVPGGLLGANGADWSLLGVQ